MRITLVPLLAFAAVVLVGCGQHAAAPGEHTTQTLPARAVRMMATPPRVLRLCRRSPLLRAICPRQLPFVNHLSSEPAYTASLCRVGHPGCAGLRWDDLEIEHAGDGSHPPIWAHLSIAAGEFRHGRPTEFHWPTNHTPVAPHNGLWKAKRRRALFLGNVRWGTRTGDLILAPSYPAGGMMSDHLIFYFRSHGHDQLLSLHAWEPFDQAVATLRHIVLSTQR